MDAGLPASMRVCCCFWYLAGDLWTHTKSVFCCCHLFYPCSITRSDLGDYKLQVVGLPVLLFVTGVVSSTLDISSNSSSSVATTVEQWHRA
jgi:hypothetical protein